MVVLLVEKMVVRLALLPVALLAPNSVVVSVVSKVAQLAY